LVVAERLTLRPAVREKVDQFWSEYLDGYYTLAVHVRGSDKAIAEKKKLHDQNAVALQMAREWEKSFFYPIPNVTERSGRRYSADASSSKPAFEQHLRTEALPNFLLPGADGYRNGM
jgi:hypothetical protein